MEISDLLNPDPMLSHRFGVFFLDKPFSLVLDFKFQKVKGISMEVNMETVREGGLNLHSHRLPEKISYSNLVLERGYLVGSPLTFDLNATFSSFQFSPSDVLITMFSQTGIPVGAWLYMKAYPVRWTVSDLDAQSNTVAIDTIELAYSRFQTMRI